MLGFEQRLVRIRSIVETEPVGKTVLERSVRFLLSPVNHDPARAPGRWNGGQHVWLRADLRCWARPFELGAQVGPRAGRH
jgi:hypothetical protein